MEYKFNNINNIMTRVISLGAINKDTGEYVSPKIANKKDQYICPECNKDLVLCQGEIRTHHFRHKKDSINPCHRYTNPTETQIHKDGKMLIKSLLELKIPISCIRNCVCCKKSEEFEIPEITETSSIHNEHRFDFNGPKIADVAYIDSNELLCIFEICNTHKTCSENRPEPWFEIDAETLITLANDNTLSQIQIPCIRCEKCDDCIEKEKLQKSKRYDIENYVRVKLGQKIFPKPSPEYCENPNKYDWDCMECDKCKYNRQLQSNDFHLKFDFDAQDDVTHNKKIIEIFSQDFINKKIVIHSRKGGCTAFVISESNYNRYEYWKQAFDDDNMPFPCEKIIPMTGEGTVNIIIKLINYCENANMIEKNNNKRMNNLKYVMRNKCTIFSI